jgi:hypothetical protein
MILYVYQTSFKVTTQHTPFQLVYGLCPLMLIEYLLPMINSHPNQDFFTTHILTNHMTKLEHLDETRQEASNWIGTRQWNVALWVQQNHKIKTFFVGNIVL